MSPHFDFIAIGSATLDVFLKSSEFRVVSTAEQATTTETKTPAEPAPAATQTAPPTSAPTTTITTTTAAPAEFMQLPYGGKMNVEEFALQSGGGATNTAVGLARLGLRTAVIAELGRDLPAKVIIQELQDEGVATAFLVQEHDENTAVSALLISADGDRTAITARGAAQQLTPSDIDLPQLRCHWVHISSVGNTAVITTVAHHCKQQHIPFSWNPGNHELTSLENGHLHLHEIFPRLLVVNEAEAQRLTTAGYDLTQGGETVVVTRGRAGVRWYERGRWQEKASKSVKMRQATGAGDAFIAGMIGAYLHDRLTPTAIDWGMRNAQAVIQKMGAKTGLLHLEDMEKI